LIITSNGKKQNNVLHYFNEKYTLFFLEESWDLTWLCVSPYCLLLHEPIINAAEKKQMQKFWEPLNFVPK